MICIGILLFSFFNDFNPKWSGKAPNEFTTGGKYSQRPQGDFRTDSRRNDFFPEENTKHITCANIQEPTKRFVFTDDYQEYWFYGQLSKCRFYGQLAVSKQVRVAEAAASGGFVWRRMASTIFKCVSLVRNNIC